MIETCYTDEDLISQWLSRVAAWNSSPTSQNPYTEHRYMIYEL